jgi:lysozyme
MTQEQQIKEINTIRTSNKGLDLIKHFEQLHDGDLSTIGLQPKLCPAGIWTVGYGRALRHASGSYLKGLKDKALAYSLYPNLTVEQASDMLNEDCKERELMVNSLNLNLKQHEFDSLVSFTYNVGFNNLKNSSLLKRIIKKDTPDSILAAFLMWDKARSNGVLVSLPGLRRRRKSEAELFLHNKLNFFTK